MSRRVVTTLFLTFALLAAHAATADDRLAAVAAHAEKKEYAQAVELLDELLPDLPDDMPQRPQLVALRATLHGRAEFSRWNAEDKVLMAAANRGEFDSALTTALAALDGVRAVDLDETGEARGDLEDLVRHLEGRVMEMELAVDTARFNALAESGPWEDALSVHTKLMERITGELAGDGLSEKQRGHMLERQKQLEPGLEWVWKQIFKDAANLVIEGKRDEGRVALNRIIAECPVDELVDKARRGIIQMDQ